MDKKALMKLVDSSKTARAMFEYFRDKPRAPKVDPDTGYGSMDLKRLRDYMVKDGFKITVAEIKENAKALAAAGVGKVDFKSTLNPRFLWREDMREVVEAVLGGGSASDSDAPPAITPQSTVYELASAITSALPKLTSQEAAFLIHLLEYKTKDN